MMDWNPIWEAAYKAEAVHTEQYNGLGATKIEPVVGDKLGVSRLTGTLDRPYHVRGIVLDADAPGQVVVQMLIAGRQIIEERSCPLSYHDRHSTRKIKDVRLVPGDVFTAQLANVDKAAAHNASGSLVGDEIDPFWLNDFLLARAVGKPLPMTTNLGRIVIDPGGTGVLSEVFNRHFLVKKIVLRASQPDVVEHSAITIAGCPMHTGSLGAAVELLPHVPLDFLGYLGSRIRISLHNHSTEPVTVSGIAIGNEIRSLGEVP